MFLFTCTHFYLICINILDLRTVCSRRSVYFVHVKFSPCFFFYFLKHLKKDHINIRIEKFASNKKPKYQYQYQYQNQEIIIIAVLRVPGFWFIFIWDPYCLYLVVYISP